MKLIFSLALLFSLPASGQWEKIEVRTAASLRGLSVVDGGVVWASGTGGTVIRTVDGGKTWSVMIVPGAEKLDFRGIRAFDGNTAVVISSGPAEKGQAHIYRTGDGGKTWKDVYEQKTPGVFFDAIAFWDRKHGIVLSDPVDGRFALFTTSNGGAAWKQIPPSALPPALPNEGAFAASNSCLTIQGERNVWFATGGATVARVFRSNERGRSWSVSETPMHPANASSGIFSLAFSDSRNGVAVGGDYVHPENSDLPNLMLTSDGGKTWQAGTPTIPAGVYFSSVAPLPQSGKDIFVAVGIKGAFVFVGGWSKAGDQNLNSVAAAKSGAQHVLAVGPKGTVVYIDITVDFYPN